ncbi:hypothetical protein K469DRAFT_698251 [Zopfia rhizophila CBS 207.26]|uniref:Uncharacterized protein n=1 Tax=Zopfia rhizophila CBS 207.26 TaxID=1314779 RepID=A0A6A6DGL0_9PEZI|nr:hypothetical protein K469DRAFT_698251 [Zopfia rhizophila CBS 207.26]
METAFHPLAWTTDSIAAIDPWPSPISTCGLPDTSWASLNNTTAPPSTPTSALLPSFPTRTLFQKFGQITPPHESYCAHEKPLIHGQVLETSSTERRRTLKECTSYTTPYRSPSLQTTKPPKRGSRSTKNPACNRDLQPPLQARDLQREEPRRSAEIPKEPEALHPKPRDTRKESDNHERNRSSSVAGASKSGPPVSVEELDRKRQNTEVEDLGGLEMLRDTDSGDEDREYCHMNNNSVKDQTASATIAAPVIV